MEAESYIEKLLVIYQVTRLHNPEYKTINNCRLKSSSLNFWVALVTQFATQNTPSLLAIINYKINFY